MLTRRFSFKNCTGPKSQAWQEQQLPAIARFWCDDGACWGIPFHQVLATHYNPKHESLLNTIGPRYDCRDRAESVGFLRPILQPQGKVAKSRRDRYSRCDHGIKCWTRG